MHIAKGLDGNGKIGYYPELAWVALFDSGTSGEDKKEIKRALRDGVERMLPRFWSRKPRNTEHLPRNMTVAIIMTGAYTGVMADLRYLREEGIADNYVFIGYSSGLKSRRKFSDGTSMTQKVFMPEEDRETLIANKKAPLLLLDSGVAAGITYTMVGRALKQRLGYEGELYQMVAGEVEPWRDNFPDNSRLTERGLIDPPIFTDKEVADRGKGIGPGMLRQMRRLVPNALNLA